MTAARNAHDAHASELLAKIKDRSATNGRDGIQLGLSTMRDLLDRIGNPERAVPPVVHVAGTNGKGSTIAFLSAILRAANKRVHTYTSPYFNGLHESIHIATDDGTHAIAPRALAQHLERVLTAMEDVPATPFEAETAAAFLAFSENDADILILETGMGGRLDATNVVDNPALTIITPISMDHAEYLGPLLTDIAREKAGILKRGAPVITARQDDDVHGTIERYAKSLNIPIHAAGRDWDAFEQHGRLVFQDENHLRDLSLPALPGRHQIENAGVAIAACLALATQSNDLAVSDAVLETALAHVQWPARLQRLRLDTFETPFHANSEVWLDGGHNAAAASALAVAMADLEDTAPLPLYLVVGMLASKNADVFLAPFRGLARTVSAVEIKNTTHATAGPMPPDIIVGAAEENGIEAHAMSSVDGAVDWIARQETGPVRILLCGSLHLAGQVLSQTIPLSK